MKNTGQPALITGASSGIGECFARQLASRGMNLVLVARSADKLRALADQLSAQHGVQTQVVVKDLSQPEAAAEVYSALQTLNIQINMLVNNAGFATHGVFDEISLERQSEEIRLNVLALVELTHTFLPSLLAAGNGAVINVASTAAFQPLPYMAVYGATKAFVLSFSEALWAENRKRGLRVLALCPGATQTPFFQVVGEDAGLGKKHTPEYVVAVALRALERGQPYVIAGLGNYLQSNFARLMPHAFTARTVGTMIRPGHARRSAQLS